MRNSLRDLVKNSLWPIRRDESLVFLPMALMIMLIMFNQYILNSIQDSLIVINSGAETLTFLRTYVVLPSSILFFFLYTRLLNIFNQNVLFYLICLIFIIFFISFTLFIYPNHESLHPDLDTEYLLQKLPQGFNGFIAIFQHWTFSLFYVVAELWVVAVMNISFWQFANNFIPLETAKRFYGHFMIFANFGAVLAGHLTMTISDLNNDMLDEMNRWEISQTYLLNAVIVSTVIIMILYKISLKNIGKDATTNNLLSKLSTPFRQSLKLVFSSKVLILITGLIMAYAVSSNILETCWKNYVKELFPLKNDYNSFQGLWNKWIGITTIITVIVGGALTRKSSLKTSIMILPAITGIMSIIFFSLIIVKDYNFLEESTILKFVVYFGLIQMIMVKSSKYALFEPTKEMLYIPMNKEFRAKGKGAVESLGSSVGKATSGAVQQILFVFIGPISVITPYLSVAVLSIVALWIISISKLDELYSKKEGIEF